MKQGRNLPYWLAEGLCLLRVFGVSWNPAASGSLGLLQRIFPGGRWYTGVHRRRRKAAGPVAPAAGPVAPAAGPVAPRFVIGRVAVAVRYCGRPQCG
jgi:hypothetical protein